MLLFCLGCGDQDPAPTHHVTPPPIRFPSYEAGHMVTMTAAAELGEDLRAWLEAEGAFRKTSH